MQIQVDIGFDDLVRMVKKLPEDQFNKLKKALELKESDESPSHDLESFLLKAPTFSEEQLEVIANTRKSINEWRTN